MSVLTAGTTTGHRLLLTRDFGLIWVSQLISQIGDGVSKLALLWFVYAITGSPIKTTIIGLLQTLPPMLLGPLIGVFVDRLPKKVLLISSDVIRAILLGLIPCGISVEWFTVDMLYLLVLLHALATAVFGPALTASVPAVVPRGQFTAANALLQGTTSIGIILGPALSGMGIAAFSSQEVLCINAVTYLGSAACLFPTRFRWRGTPAASLRTRSTFQEFLDGLRFTMTEQRILLLMMATASFYTFGTSALTTLFPVFGRKLLDLGPVEVGYLWSMLGVGLLAMSIALSRWSHQSLEQRMRMIASTTAVSGISIATLALVRNPFVVAVLMSIIGAGMAAMTPIAWGVLQELSPPHMVGRILALYTTAAMTAAIGGISAFGWITEAFGEPASIFGIGGVLLTTSVIAAGVSRSDYLIEEAIGAEEEASRA